MKKNIFVTGAGGFIGSQVACRYVLEGNCVVGIGRKAQFPLSSHPTCNFAYEEGPVELGNLERLASQYGVPDVLLHCAGSASVTFSIENPLEDFKKNLDTLSEVLEFSRRHACFTKVIILSSAAVYGTPNDKTPIKEENVLNPVSPYGLHKRLAEELCKFYANYWQVPIIAIRLFSVYGNALRKQLLWDACNKLKAKEYVFAGTGSEERDWLHIDDAVRLLLLSEQYASPNCPIVNGGTGIGHSVKHVLSCMGELWDSISVPGFSGVSRAGDPLYLVADTSQIKKWGFTPEVSLIEGLKSYIAWYKTEFGL